MKAPQRKWEEMGSLLTGLPLESAISELLTMPRNWQPWQGQSLQDQQGPKKSKHQNIENRRHGSYREAGFWMNL